MQLPAASEVRVPGRVNLIGEHIDYHGLPVLPIAIGRYLRLRYRLRDDRLIRVSSAGYGFREFEWTSSLAQGAAGDWENYLRAAAMTVGRKWGTGCGIDATIQSDLPAAAGLSSSSALIVAMVMALHRAGFEELMEILPEGEQFVGTRGGGMDHAAVLASRAGCASLIEFQPLSVRHIPIPPDWGFLVAHSLEAAEKSCAALEKYNSVRDSPDAAAHTASEAGRVRDAVSALEQCDAGAFGRLLTESHASLRDRLKVSCPALDRLVETAMEGGATGARLTGAGFGGCAVVFAARQELPAIRAHLKRRYYAGRPEFREGLHLLDAEPSPGVLYAE